MIKKEYPSNTPEMKKNSPSLLKEVYSQDKNHYASSPITDRILPNCVYIIEPSPTQPRTQASSRYPSYPTSLIGDVTSEIAEDDWERGCPPPHPFAKLQVFPVAAICRLRYLMDSFYRFDTNKYNSYTNCAVCAQVLCSAYTTNYKRYNYYTVDSR